MSKEDTMSITSKALSAARSLVSSQFDSATSYQRAEDSGPQGYVWVGGQEAIRKHHWCSNEAEKLHVNYVYCQINRIWVSRNNDVQSLTEGMLIQ